MNSNNITFNEFIMELEYMDNIERNIDNFNSWLKERKINGDIKFDLKHKTYLGELLQTEDVNKFMENFELVFHDGYLTCNVNKIKDKNNNVLLFGNMDECGECGERISLVFDGETIKDLKINYENHERIVKNIDCIELNDYSVDICFPSGVLLCDDWLPYASELLMDLDEHKHRITSSLGIYERTNNYAKENIFHIFVGGTSPNVYLKDGLVTIGSPKFKDYYDEDEIIEDEDEIIENEIIEGENYEEYIHPVENAEIIAEISTNLWWATIVDAEIYKNLLIKKFGEVIGLAKFSHIKEEIATKTITPGIYRCTYLNDYNDYNDETPIIFSKMELIKEL